MLELERPDTLVQRVVNSIREEIASGRLLAESRLPTEHQLAEQLNVSRSVIREAVSQLKADGILISRRGFGSYISKTPAGTVFRLPSKNGHTLDLAQLFEMRLWIEAQAAGIAASRRNAADLRRMEKALEVMAANASDFDLSAAADVEFHRAIAAACRNEYFLAFHDFLGSQLTAARRTAWENSAALRGGSMDAQNEHRELFAAIALGDPETAAKCAERHLQASAGRLGMVLPNSVYHRSQD
ncbi:GntR family regulatory protein [Azotobacter vinelandii CA]|uniref:Bacterial regulatory protein, GntR family n=2 Tax=Azotobacter vinelandii TaxID=354 RepID=C1DJU2_AZOVD|nr:FadR/GntR family transcriptional regulator [Azotobacter vinelandii]ACO78861.1 Bacterial regulatory protein, GntR family [Azotobacter vinelandii DJ]AGK16573.1 GntR family regulatory protein [Azotobacter vinelandii CA]AGK20812.1 GntR family regulatory protein [Azotobacter vinelandii CA6]WKN19865.1 FadR family transcriptional regulator [Azotobacter vinelandii]SFY29363.1 transcriptional regulator, GntR family [Azotobacter vinelandii]